MDSFFGLLTSLSCSKYYEEQIVDNLRDIHSEWKITCEETEVVEDESKCEQEEANALEEEDLKAVDELLAKAQKLISQVNLGAARPSSRRSVASASNSNESKPASLKSPTESKLPSRPSTALNGSKTKPVPVYMNAPYRTEPVVSSVKRSRSVATLADKQGPRTSIVEKPENEKKRPEFKPREAVRKVESNIEISNRNSQLVKMVRFEDMAPTLSVPSRFSNLSAQNSKLSESLYTEMKNRKIESRNSFLERLNEAVIKPKSALENNFNLNRMAVMYQQASIVLDQYCFLIKAEHNLAKPDSKNQNLTALFRAKVVLKKAKEFNQVINNIFRHEREKFKINSNTETKSTGSDLLITDAVDSLVPTMRKISYEKYEDLKDYVEVKCNLIEAKFNRMFLSHLESFYIDDILRNEKRLRDNHFYEYSNILFSLVLGKRTLIVK